MNKIPTEHIKIANGIAILTALLNYVRHTISHTMSSVQLNLFTIILP